jgi:hypothetical protein
MNKPTTTQKKDSYISTPLAEYYIDNNRKFIVSQSYHYDSEFIDIRSWLKTSSLQGSKWLPTRKGIFFPVKEGKTFWADLNKVVSSYLGLI